MLNAFRLHGGLSGGPVTGIPLPLSKAVDEKVADLLDGLFGPRRQLYKRVAEYSYFQRRELHAQHQRRRWCAYDT